MTHQERELVWLLDKIQRDEAFIQRAEDYFFDRHHEWSAGFTAHFQDELKQLKDQLYYKEYRLERLSWEIIQSREALEVSSFVRHASDRVDDHFRRVHPRRDRDPRER